MRYYKDAQNNLYENPIVENHVDLVQITEFEFNSILEEKNTPTQAELDAKRVIEIDTRLKEIDLESLRPLRAFNSGTQTQYDIDKLNNLDIEAEALRVERTSVAVI